MIRVNNTTFDDNAIVAEMQYHSAETHTQAKNKACEALIVAELVKQRAADLNLAVDELATQDDALSNLLDKEIEFPTATDSDCRTYFENNRQKFASSPLVSGRHILLAVPADEPNARSEALEQARALIRELTGNLKDFPKLAAQYSRCPSAKTGGHLGQISKGQTVPEFERQIFQCEAGLVEAPIESRYGVHVVEIDHKVEGKPLPYEAVEKRIAEYLNEKVKRKAIAQYIQQLIAEADIEGFDMHVSESPLMQ